MSQPPYPPQGGNDPSGRQPGQQGWGRPEDAAQQAGQPAPPTSQFQPGQYGQPAGERDQTAPFGQPQYDQQQYGQPQYGQPQYGQPHGAYDPNQQYGQQQYGQQQYGQPYGQQPPKDRKNLVIALTVGGVLLLAGLAVGLFFLLRGGDSTPVADPTTSSSPSSTPSSAPSSSSSAPSSSSSAGGGTGAGATSAPQPPTGPGPDEEGDWQGQADACFAGDYAACDDLWIDTPVDSAWEDYAGTCAGRVDYESGTCESRLGGGGSTTASDPQPPIGLGADEEGDWQGQADACFAGDYAVCDDLWLDTPVGSDWEEYAGTCAGRVEYQAGTLELRLG